MGCFAFLIGLATPRLGLFAFWLLRPDRVDEAFDTFVFPFLGILFVPTATFLYAVLASSAEGITGWGWFWVVVAACFDLVHALFAVADRERVRRR